MTFREFRNKVAAIAVWLYFKTSIARVWWLAYQALWERKAREVKLQRFADFNQFVNYVRNLKWRADSWRELFDATSSVKMVQWLADNDPRRLIGDCDEFGHYEAAIIQNELLDDPHWGIKELSTTKGMSIVSTAMLSVMWDKLGGETWEGNNLGPGGHNVCLLKFSDGTYSYMDYSWPSTRVATIGEVAEQVRRRYAQEYTKLGWAAHEPVTLKLLDARWDE